MTEGTNMMQKSFFDNVPTRASTQREVPLINRYIGAVTYGAVGDALGWPTEFFRSDKTERRPFGLPVRDFVTWKKLVGGKWWGYEDTIKAGQYSDDTQLSLAVARCINEDGLFEPERFAYEELPLWLQYERGGGKAIKTAARKLIGRRADWLKNFYKQGDLDYRNAGANGSAMRNLPIALANVGNTSRIVKESFLNSIITHGHPRAIIGAILSGLAANFAVTTVNDLRVIDLVDYLCTELGAVDRYIGGDERLNKWIQSWEQKYQNTGTTFRVAFNKSRDEASSFLRAIPGYLASNDASYYDFVGALNPATKGSGIGTVCTVVYLFTKYASQPEAGLMAAVNMYGSDTDTIASILGSMLGAHYGLGALPDHLFAGVQDRDYLVRTATRLHSIASGEQRELVASTKQINRTEAYLRILAWEIGLHEMFWDALGDGDKIAHPTLGRGTIRNRATRAISRDGYIAKLISIDFDCGQTCVFHSLVRNETRVSESLAEEIDRALDE
jgi:ADP-ribosylglycohydrolase